MATNHNVTPYKSSNMSTYVDFTALLEKYGTTDDGYEKAIEEAVDITQNAITSPDKATPVDMRAEAEDLVLRLAFARIASSGQALDALKGFFLNESPHNVAPVTKYLFRRFGNLQDGNFK